MDIKSKKLINICHDYNLNLQMYNLKNNFILQIKRITKKNLKFTDINKISTNSKLYNNIEIFWGNRLTIVQAKKFKNLKWVHLGSSGYDKKLLFYLLKMNIKVSNSRGVFTNPVVSSIFAHIFAISRGIHLSYELRSNLKLDRLNYEKYFDNISDVFDESFLIVGLGEIGTSLANNLSSFSANICAIKSKIVKKKIKNIKNIYLLKDIKKIIGKFKFIINLLPHNEHTDKIFNKSIFSLMRDGSVFINVGRGDTVNTGDLIKSINQGKIFASAIDVYPKNDYVNPYKPSNLKSKIFSMPEIITTPHIAGFSNSYWNKEINLFSENLNKYYNNKVLINQIK